MSHYVFLRGINVGGVKMAMADLKASLEGAGFKNVKTYLATGNVRLDSEDLQGFELKAKLEAFISARFNYEAKVLLRSREALAAIVETAATLVTGSDFNLQVVLCDSPDTARALVEAFEAGAKLEGESVQALGAELIWRIKKGETLSSAFGNKVLGDKRYKAKVTTRNLNTIEKMLK